jgi:hypothetical protein
MLSHIWLGKEEEFQQLKAIKKITQYFDRSVQISAAGRKVFLVFN